MISYATDDLQIDIFQLPSEARAAVIMADRHITTGENSELPTNSWVKSNMT